MSDAVIVCEAVGKAYPIYGRPSDRLLEMVWGGPERHRKFWALRDASFEIKQGETVGIIGGNGSGKSTLLKLICGTLRPTTGRVLTAGRVVGLLELGAGFNPEFTGLENIRLAAVVLGLSTEEMEARLPAIEAFADLGDFIAQPVKHYSSGMYARLAFAVAAHVDADVLVVDEILSVGDAAFSQRCMRWLRQFRERGTLLFASHDLTAVMNLCDRAIWIKQAVIQATGPARDVCGAYRLDALDEADLTQDSRAVPVEQNPGLWAQGEVPPPRAARLSKVSLSPYNRDASWYGKGEFTVRDMAFADTGGRSIETCRFGDALVLNVDVAAHADTNHLIVGFLVTDARGYYIFGQNTLAGGAPISALSGDTLRATFQFEMPALHPGSYFVLIGVSEGSQLDFVEQQWIERAIRIVVEGPPLLGGLMEIGGFESRP
jgi:lipopolysaccharide transport system ATP-binding protein